MPYMLGKQGEIATSEPSKSKSLSSAVVAFAVVHCRKSGKFLYSVSGIVGSGFSSISPKSPVSPISPLGGFGDLSFWGTLGMMGTVFIETSMPADFAKWYNVLMVTPCPWDLRQLLYCWLVSAWV